MRACFNCGYGIRIYDRHRRGVLYEYQPGTKEQETGRGNPRQRAAASPWDLCDRHGSFAGGPKAGSVYAGVQRCHVSLRGSIFYHLCSPCC